MSALSLSLPEVLELLEARCRVDDGPRGRHALPPCLNRCGGQARSLRDGLCPYCAALAGQYEAQR